MVLARSGPITKIRAPPAKLTITKNSDNNNNSNTMKPIMIKTKWIISRKIVSIQQLNGAIHISEDKMNSWRFSRIKWLNDNQLFSIKNILKHIIIIRVIITSLSYANMRNCRGKVGSISLQCSIHRVYCILLRAGFYFM